MKTVREGLLAIWRANGARPEDKPEPLRGHADHPPHFPWIWGWLFDFHADIVLTWSEISAWAQLRGIHPASWEIRLLLKLQSMRL